MKKYLSWSSGFFLLLSILASGNVFAVFGNKINWSIKSDSKDYTITANIPDIFYIYADSIEYPREVPLTIVSSSIEIYDKIYSKNLKIYKNELQLKLPKDADSDFEISYQYCDTVLSICLPKETQTISTKKLSITQKKQVINPYAPANIENNENEGLYKTSLFENELGFLEKNLYLVLIYIFFLGVLVSLSPCHFSVYPLIINILTVGQSKNEKITTLLSYILGLFVVFSGIAGLLYVAGNQVYLSLNNIYISWFSVLLLLYLGCLTLGVVKFDIFTKLTSSMSTWQDKALQIRANAIKAFCFGLFSSILTTGCISAPILALLIFMQEYKNLTFMMVALLTFVVAMSVPLFLFLLGISIFRRLPASILEFVNTILGTLVLLFAVFLIERLIPELIALVLFCALLAWFIYQSSKDRNVFKIIISLLALIYAVLVVNFYVETKKLNLITPLSSYYSNSSSMLMYDDIIQREFNDILAQNTNVVLYFSSKYCSNCKLLDQNLHSLDLSKYKLMIVKIDLTKLSDYERELVAKYDVIGVPTMVFYKDGMLAKDLTIVGYKDSQALEKRFDWLSM